MNKFITPKEAAKDILDICVNSTKSVFPDKPGQEEKLNVEQEGCLAATLDSLSKQLFYGPLPTER